MIKRFGTLFGANILAQGVNFLLLPFVTRLFDPKEFGQYSEFYAYFQILLPVSALCLPLAIVLAKSEMEAESVACASRKSTVCVSVFITFLLAAFYWMAPKSFSASNLLLPLVVLAAGYQQVAYQFLIRREAVSLMAVLAVAQASLMSISKIVGGLFWPTYTTLVATTVIGYSLFSALTMAFARRVVAGPYKPPPFSRQKYAFAKHRQLPQFRTPQVLLNGIGRTMPILFLSYFAPSSEVGQFALAFTAMGAALLLVGNAVSGVFMPRMALAFRQSRRTSELLCSASASVFVISLLGFGVIIASGPELFELIFGNQWTSAGQYAQVMAPWFILSLTARPSTDSIAAYGLNRQFLIFEICGMFIRFGSLFLGLNYGGPMMAICAFSFANAALYAVLILGTHLFTYRFSSGGAPKVDAAT